MRSQELFQENHRKWTVKELRSYNGLWVAFSADGTEIVASAEDLPSLRDHVREAGADPEEVWYERVAIQDDWQGGVELE